MANRNPVKERVGVPPGKGSRHTAEVAGYFIEGHVPAEDVQRLLAERPVARGLSVPGMPMGAPGMPVAPGQERPYDVLLVANDGRSEEHTSELQSLMRISYAVFCLKKKKKRETHAVSL